MTRWPWDASAIPARASGVRTDARIDHPTTELPVTEVGAIDGDVLARYTVRRDEFAASVELACELAESHTRSDRIPGADRGQASGTTSGVGIVEGWRGTIVHRVEVDSAATRHPRQDRRPVLVQLARIAGRNVRHDCSGLPADQ